MNLSPHIRALAIAVVSIPLAEGAWPQAVVQSARIEIRMESPQVARVTAQYQLEDAASAAAQLSHVAMLPPGSSLDALRAASEGEELVSRTDHKEHSLRIIVQRPENWTGRYQIEYRVSTAEPALRVPIPVPEFAKSQPRSVTLSLAIPGGFVAADWFPRFHPSEQGWSAALNDVPSFVMVRLRGGNQPSFAERFLSIEAFTNYVIASLFVTFAVSWWRLRGRRQP